MREDVKETKMMEGFVDQVEKDGVASWLKMSTNCSV